MPAQPGARAGWPITGAIAALVLVFGLAPTASAGNAGARVRAHPAKRADFNGDGFTDLAVGAPSTQPRGAVTIVYGSPDGLVADNMDTLAPQSGDPGQFFGNGLASADFNRDGFADLAVGSPGVTVAGATDAGRVTLLFGSALGLRSDNPRFFTENTPGIPGTASENDYFGATIVAGDFDGDGHPDLAIGAPIKTVDGLGGAGIIDVLPGGPGGPTGAGGDTFSFDTPGIVGEPHFAEFGISMAAGNLGRGPEADLVIGAPSDTVAGVTNMGSVHVLFGSPGGLTTVHTQRWTGVSAGQPGGAGQFGVAVAIGNVGKSGANDLVIGAGSGKVQGIVAGEAFVLYGSDQGPVANGDARISEATRGVPTAPKPGDDFGAALAVQDFDGDGQADLAVSAPEKSSPGTTDLAGWVFVVPGGTNGVVPPGATAFAGVDLAGQTPDTRLLAGRAMTVGDFGQGSGMDLAVGIPDLVAGGNHAAGGVAVLFGGTTGLSSSNLQLVDGDTISGFPNETNNQNGIALVGSPHSVD